MYGTGMNVF